MRSWRYLRLVLTGAAFPELPKLLLVQALSSCSWKCAAPVGHSPEPCSSPVLLPSDGILRLGTAFWSPGQGHLGSEVLFRTVKLPGAKCLGGEINRVSSSLKPWSMGTIQPGGRMKCHLQFCVCNWPDKSWKPARNLGIAEHLAGPCGSSVSLVAFGHFTVTSMQNAFCKRRIHQHFSNAPEKWICLCKEENIMIPCENGTIHRNQVHYWAKGRK